ncbi:hypothetical protein RCC89_09005 [Cytophagaceae bacterium ABcell3]|nr:hypothetical protein RCC89_09005 [Cytophagaceae bacterium ABcell3]
MELFFLSTFWRLPVRRLLLALAVIFWDGVLSSKNKHYICLPALVAGGVWVKQECELQNIRQVPASDRFLLRRNDRLYIIASSYHQIILLLLIKQCRGNLFAVSCKGWLWGSDIRPDDEIASSFLLVMSGGVSCNRGCYYLVDCRNIFPLILSILSSCESRFRQYNTKPDDESIIDSLNNRIINISLIILMS